MADSPKFQDRGWSWKDQDLIRGLELPVPLCPQLSGKGKRLKFKLITEAQRYKQVCRHNKVPITAPKDWVWRASTQLNTWQFPEGEGGALEEGEEALAPPHTLWLL